ncbi:Uma2 family endonuclease [Tsukamurella sp. USMM236]|uniref:Uma2 family endonuclease n=1 Tax=Tsukamurella sp. USMM236 TaxID=3081301 RepID=UPI003019890F
MTAAPQHPETMSLEQWCALGEDTSARFELVRGVVDVSPRPRLDHAEAMIELCHQIRGQIDRSHRCLAEIEVVIDGGARPTIRVPDVVLFERGAGQPMPAERVRLVVEILSPNNRRTDQVVKRAEYERAGIDAYWIVDLDDGPSGVLLTLVDGAYRAETVRGAFTATMPCPLRIDLDALSPQD